MRPLSYMAVSDLGVAMARAARMQAEFIAGGTDMLQLLQEDVRRPAELIDINGLSLGGIEITEDGAHIGALARMTEVADHPRIRERFPAVTESLLASASAQVRNMASIGGNLLQRTRCLYFRDVATPCNKRRPGSGCPAIEGLNRMNAVLGTSAHCIAVYPGDLAVALLALDAHVEIIGLHGSRSIPVGELHRAPGDTPDVETTLEPGEIITAVAIPSSGHAARSHYLKVRDRASFEFALASAAVAIDTVDGVVTEARVAIGGVATKPWRLPEVEEVLVGYEPTAERVQHASRQAGRGAKAYQYNAYKIELMRRVVERALSELGVQR